ncbi:uncharacterized protein A4U43_C04F10920 [Asparagus officinalis]|uniref:Uncharacterized protein n=1 Tax=Asparagus officinalis TaxID=4686 RepID=A0A5P1F4R9_ASPOF|nr:uncharacterized protein LOC109835868 [Asparagus officinalis]ONK71651.1 uncharacterized protein A4U43_C04F10920 [Asparagus officinalis]
MGACASGPKTLDDATSAPTEKPEVTNPGECGDINAPVQAAEAEKGTEPETKEEPLVDLSEPEPEASKSGGVDLAPEISELTVDAPKLIVTAPVAEQVNATVVKETKTEEEVVVEEKTVEAKESKVVEDEKESESKISA